MDLKTICKKTYKAAKKTWDNFFEPAVNVAAPFITMAVAAKSKNPLVSQATTKKWNQYRE